VFVVCPIWFWEWLDGISMRLQLNVALRQKTFVAQINTRPGFLDAFFSGTHQRDSIAH
jgi:hypothetical protein